MQLTLTGHHVEVTPALRTYVEKKLDRIVRHFDNVIDVHCVLTVQKLQHKAEATLAVSGAKIHADAVGPADTAVQIGASAIPPPIGSVAPWQ